MEPEDLAVIGHTGDLLVDIYARNLTHIYILPQCSTTAARVLNPAGMDAQFERLRCAISRGILNVVRKTQASVDKQYYSQIGDVIIPTSGETPEEISTASCVMLPDIILAGDLNIYRCTQVDGRIMSYILNHVVNDRIARIAQGKSVVHVQAAELSKIEITYPDPFSQKTIIAILAAISDRIDQSNAELRLLHELRKALLQKLFI